MALRPRHIGVPLLMSIVLVSGCTSFGPDWQLRKQTSQVAVYLRESSTAGLPEFRATLQVEAPMASVMEALTDFSHHPDWIYHCQRVSVIALKGYSEAYLYQVNALPIIQDRDMILHAVTTSADDGSRIEIRIESAPDYCNDNDDEDCAAISQSNKVRVTRASGTFVLTRVDAKTTAIEWQQFIDPAGALPHWLFALMLAQVPTQSLQRFKSIVEQQ